MVVSGVSDLASRFPELLEEWNYEKNIGISPNEISPYSTKEVYWKCAKGHEWKTRVASRACKGNGRRPGCPFCNGKKPIKGENDLVTVCPDIAKEWNYEKNDGLIPEDYFRNSTAKVWWKCSLCGYEWNQSIGTRTRNNKLCPCCTKKKIQILKTTPIKGQSFYDVFPKIAEEWNYEKNENTPQEYMPHSSSKVWWKCSICNREWQATIANRTTGHSNCPECAKESHVSFPEKAIFYYVKKYCDSGEVIENYKINIKQAHKPEIDIYIPLKKIGIEYDGEHWHTNPKKDKKKDEICQIEGITLIRVREPKCSGYEFTMPIVKLESLSEESLEKGIREVLTLCYGSKEFYDISISRDRGFILDYISFQKKSNSLMMLYPQIAIDWDYEKNGNLTPETVGASSGRKVWWKCHKCGYEWEAKISSRTGKGTTGCPLCTGSIIVPGVNDFATLRPDMAKEWDYERNLGLTPLDISLNSHTKIWWKCKNGHNWQVNANSRVNNNTNCPICSKKEAGLKMSVADKSDSLASLYPQVALDWDYDNNEGFTPNSILATSARRISWKCHVCGNRWTTSLRDRTTGARRCPYCVGKKAIPGKTDLKTVFPQVAAEWDYDKNAPLTPDVILPKSNCYAYWICDRGHSYRTKISSRTQMGSNCPVCSGQQVLEGYNDLATKNPQLADEWDYQLNGELKPSNVTLCSTKNVWWKCKKGHSFRSQVSTRTTMHTGCPYCSGKRAIPGETDFVTLHPDIAKDWDYSANTLNPSSLRPGSNKNVYWKCHICGKTWEATILDRCKGYKKCPDCYRK